MIFLFVLIYLLVIVAVLPLSLISLLIVLISPLLAYGHPKRHYCSLVMFLLLLLPGAPV